MLRLVAVAGQVIAPVPSDFDAREFAKWDVEPTGDYTRDCETGRAVADQLIEFVREGGFPGTLGNAIGSMMSAGREASGIEIGFCQRLATAIR